MYKVSIAIVSLLFLANYAQAWVEPKAGDEIPAPINTSNQEQTKLGILDVGNWIKVLTSPFNFNIGVQAPKFCIQKPDGTTSCCPPAAGQDWSACANQNNNIGGIDTDTKWVWNATPNLVITPYPANPLNSFSKYVNMPFLTGSYDLMGKDPQGEDIPLNDVCKCFVNKDTINKMYELFYSCNQYFCPYGGDKSESNANLYVSAQILGAIGGMTEAGYQSHSFISPTNYNDKNYNWKEKNYFETFRGLNPRNQYSSLYYPKNCVVSCSPYSSY